MIYRLLLAFVLISALAPVSTAALSGDTKAHQSPPQDSDSVNQCDPRVC